MKLQLLCLKDLAVQAFMQPFFSQSNGGAVREFSDMVNGDHQVSKHPEDYEMYSLGEFDDSDGSIALHKSPQILARAIDLKISKS